MTLLDAAMPMKRQADDDGAPLLPAKASRADLRIEYDAAAAGGSRERERERDRESAAARRKGASNRTGQACDRCKVRTTTPRAPCCHTLPWALHCAPLLLLFR